MKQLKKLLAALVLMPALVIASEAGYPLDRAPDRGQEISALQIGANLFAE